MPDGSLSTQSSAIAVQYEDHPTHPGGWDRLPHRTTYELPEWRKGEAFPPGYQAETYFKSVRTTEDGAEVWTWGRIDPETRAAGWVAGGARRDA